MNLSIIIPVYNSEKILPYLIESISNNLKKRKISYEVILVNDHSKDQSWKTIINLSKIINSLKELILQKTMANTLLYSLG